MLDSTSHVSVRRLHCSGVRGLTAVAVLAAVLAGHGCLSPKPPSPPPDPGAIWMFPGVETGPWCLSEAARGLRNGGVLAEPHYYDWPAHLRPLDDLTNYARNRAEARRVAAEIAEYHRQHPHALIDLAGYSGGGGMALMVVEALPDSVRVRHILLMQPAVSAGYDLTPALHHADGLIVNFHSTLDWLVLGVGTQIFGTMDRRHASSAGKNGFDLAKAVLDEKLRSRVRQCAWQPDMISVGHDGGHLGILGYEWNRRYVAPWLTTAH